MNIPQTIDARLRRVGTKIRGLLAGRDRGTVAITFLLSLPILLIIIGILTQFVLMANARLTVDRAAAAAARAAMTSIPTDPVIDLTNGEANVRQAARLILESISPAATFNSFEAQTIADNLTLLGLQVPSGFNPRYSYAEDGTTITITYLSGRANPSDTWAQVAAPQVRIDISYPFRLTVPIVNLYGVSATHGGILGYYTTYSTSVIVQLSDGREARTDADGNPSGGAAIPAGGN